MHGSQAENHRHLMLLRRMESLFGEDKKYPPCDCEPEKGVAIYGGYFLKVFKGQGRAMPYRIKQSKLLLLNDNYRAL